MALEISGAERVQAALKALGPKASESMAASLYQEAERIMTDSKTTFVPVDTGVLRASGRVDQPVQLGGCGWTVTMGYGGGSAQYALAVHENPRAGKTGGVSPRGIRYKHWARVGEWKYLETPFKAAIAGFMDRIAARLEQVLRATR